MYIKRNLDWKILWKLSWKNLIVYTLWSLLVFSLYHFLGWHTIDIPYEPLALIGIAVAFYTGFKNSQSYDRFWEARKIWGGIVNYSRTFSNQVIHLVEDDSDTKKELIYRHLAWINALRLQLREKNSFSQRNKKVFSPIFNKKAKEDIDFSILETYITKQEMKNLELRKNRATHLIKNQTSQIKKLLKENKISEFDNIIFHRTLEELYNLQGKSERIKNTPFPRQYASVSIVFKWIFIVLLPLGLLNIYELQIENIELENRWWFLVELIPLSVLVSWVFSTMEKIGSISEDPFEGTINDVPMTSICRTIEIDLRDMLDEEELPSKLSPIDNVLY